jgi:LuxR family maltose regulon positive regulatory protein
LTDRLLFSLPAPLVVLAAPAGYSKTTTLRAWADLDRRPVPWVTCDWRHNDPAVFLQEIATALYEVRPNLAEETATVLGMEAAWPERALSRLGRELDSPGPDFALVIDDAHLLETDSSVALLDGLTRALPAGGQLVISSRSSPPLKLGRMRANRELVEIGIQDLKMTRRESRQLLSAAGPDLTKDQADAIHERTEGWPAALQLAALALADREDVDAAVAAFAGDDRVVVDYLNEEFLSVADPELITFMTRSSLLDELSGPLCDAALDRAGSARILEQLVRSNALVIPVDRRSSTYRYHHLLSDMLRANLNRSEPEAAKEIHARASDWYTRNSTAQSAVEHAILSGDSCLSGRLIWESLPDLTGRGQVATLSRWLDEIGRDRMTECHGLMFTAAHVSMVTGSGEQAGYWRTLAETIEPRPGCPIDVESDLCMLKASYPTEGVSVMAAEAERVCELKNSDDVWFGAAQFYRGVSAHLLGGEDRARLLLRESAQRTAVRSPIIQSLALAELALIELSQGGLDLAVRLASEARNQVDRCGIAEYLAMAAVFATGALVKAADGLNDKAREDLQIGTRMVEQLDGFPPWYEAQARIALAGACVRLGHAAEARRLTGEARVHFELTPDATLLGQQLAVLETLTADPANSSGETFLTRSERRTLEYLPTHLTFRQIGEVNNLSANTVKTQARSIYRKLGVNSRAEAVECARRERMFDGDQVKMI